MTEELSVIQLYQKFLMPSLLSLWLELLGSERMKLIQ